MTSEQRKVKARGTRASARRVLNCAALLGILACIGLFTYLTRFVNDVTPPVYEEALSAPSELSRELEKVDKAIYESLYREGVQVTDVLFLAVKSRHEREGFSIWTAERRTEAWP